MQITVAKSAGYCFGVKRAVDEVYRQIETGLKPVYTYGPVIHNEQVMEKLEKKGVRVIRGEEELSDVSGGTIIIRAHGIGRDLEEKLRKTGCGIVDATCPFVKKIHESVDQESKNGVTVIIAGSPRHQRLDERTLLRRADEGGARSAQITGRSARDTRGADDI